MSNELLNKAITSCFAKILIPSARSAIFHTTDLDDFPARVLSVFYSLEFEISSSDRFQEYLWMPSCAIRNNLVNSRSSNGDMDICTSSTNRKNGNI